jgi:hypothetical protein
MTTPDPTPELKEQGQAFIEQLMQHQPSQVLLDEATQVTLYATAVQTLKASQFPQAFALFGVLATQNFLDARYLSGMAHAAQAAGEMGLALPLHAAALGVANDHEPYLLDLAQGLIAVQNTDLARVLLALIATDSKFAADAAQLAQRALAVEALLEHAA